MRQEYVPVALIGDVDGAADGEGPLVQNMGVDHGRADILVAQEFLDCADIVSCLEEMGREAVAERVASGRLDDPRPADGAANDLLQGRLGQMVPALDPGPGVERTPGAGKRYVQPSSRSALGCFSARACGR